MSHFTELKTNISEGRFLKQALKSLGYNVVEENGGVSVGGYLGATIPAEFKITTSTHYDIGFVKNEQGHYEVVGDWEILPQVSGIEQETFVQQVKREYAKTAIQELARASGYSLETLESEETGNIEMVVTQW